MSLVGIRETGANQHLATLRMPRRSERRAVLFVPPRCLRQSCRNRRHARDHDIFGGVTTASCAFTEDAKTNISNNIKELFSLIAS